MTVAAKKEATEQQESSQEQSPDEDGGSNPQLASVGDLKEGSTFYRVVFLTGPPYKCQTLRKFDT